MKVRDVTDHVGFLDNGCEIYSDQEPTPQYSPARMAYQDWKESDNRSRDNDTRYLCRVLPIPFFCALKGCYCPA